MVVMDLTDLMKTCHETAKSKGFWDTERNQGEACALIVSELFEALEAHRKGKKAMIGALKNWQVLELSEQKILFEQYVKDTFEDELADTVIRILDYCAGFKLADEIHIELPFMFSCYYKGRNFGEYCMSLLDYVVGAYNDITSWNYIVNELFYMCEMLGIDLLAHINAKLKYNTMRAYKHGKLY